MSNSTPIEIPAESADLEPVKSSKLSRIKSNLIMVGVFTIPTVLLGGGMYATWKMTAMQLETAKVNLEAAKVNNPES